MTETLPDAVRAAAAAGTTAVEIWFQDEARVGQQGTLARVWADKGSKATRAARPALQVGLRLRRPLRRARHRGRSRAALRQRARHEPHLAGTSRHISPGAHAVVVLDRAGRHRQGGRLRVPDNISLLHLPPYSPELNPVENVWAHLRSNKLSNRVCATYGTIVDTCCDAWTWLMNQPDRIISIATRAWATVIT